MSQQPFAIFIDLVQFDQNVRTDKNSIALLEKEVAALVVQQNSLIQQLDVYKTNVHEFRKQVDTQELTMKELDNREREKKETLDGISNYKEYQAIQVEIDKLKHAQHEGEKTLMNMWNKLETAQQALALYQKEYDEKFVALKKALKEKEDAVQSVCVRIEAQKDKRAAKEKNVPFEWLEKYNVMSMRVPDPVVEVTNGGCGACFYFLTDQQMIQLRRKALLQCKGCFRLLYLKVAMDAADSDSETQQ